MLLWLREQEHVDACSSNSFIMQVLFIMQLHHFVRWYRFEYSSSMMVRPGLIKTQSHILFQSMFRNTVCHGQGALF